MADAPPSSPAPALSPRARRLAGGLLAVMLLVVAQDGIPSRLANPLYVFGGLTALGLLTGRGPRFLPHLGVALIAGSAALVTGDLVMRFVFPDVIYHGPIDRLVRRLPAYPTLRGFTPHVDLHLRTFGYLEAIRPPGAERVYRDIRFVTDELEFRNFPEALDEEVDLVLLGDSFVLGAEVTQEDTWSHLLRTRHEVKAYNLSFPTDPWRELLLFKTMVERIPLRRGGAVVWGIFPANDYDGKFGSLEALAPAGVLRQLNVRMRNFRKRSPIRILSARLWPRWESDPLGPVVSAQLPAGPEVLFYREYIEAAHVTAEKFSTYESATRTGPVFREMQRFTRERGWDLLVVLIPSKFELYPELLPDETAPGWPGAYAALVLEECRRAGIPVADLWPVFRSERKALLERGELFYWPDDTHWNRNGTEVAARVVAEWWRNRTSLVEGNSR